MMNTPNPGLRDRAEPLVDLACVKELKVRLMILALSVVGITALLGFGGIAVAQSDGAETTSTAVIVHRTAGAQTGDAQPTFETARTIFTGEVWSQTWEATDPRLTGSATYHSTAYTFEDFELKAIAVRVENDEGAWVGTGREVFWAEPFGSIDMLELSGEGAYEGLSALLTEDGMHEPHTLRGAIVYGGLPPFPEPAQ
jgi:hypothetical protein